MKEVYSRLALRLAWRELSAREQWRHLATPRSDGPRDELDDTFEQWERNALAALFKLESQDGCPSAKSSSISRRRCLVRAGPPAQPRQRRFARRVCQPLCS